MTASPLLFVAHTGNVSGAEKVLLHLVAAAVGEGRPVTVACPTGPLAERLPEAVAHVELPPLGLGGESGVARVVGAGRLLGRWMRAGRILRPLIRRRETVTIVNSLFALPAVRVGGGRSSASWLVHDTVVNGKQRAVTTIGKPAIRKAVAVSEATADPLRTMGFPVVVAHNGVPWPVPRLGGDLHSPPVVGMLALLTPWKGHRVLLDAVARLPHVELELAGGSFPGDAGYVAELEARATAPDLAGRVRFLGHVDPAAAMAGWDVVVSASVLPEAGPLNVLEAMSHGLPVVGSDHGGTSEFLAGGAGVPYPAGDAAALAAAIQRVLDDAELRRSVGDAARAYVAAHHDVNATIPAMLHALAS
ncbi:glycosyl transferase [Mycolicibacterium arabiense]|uniref:Glycosyl transferase n=1 Tax=Mycolicibacterium arabiense TaxID=1286181 RepID=A0A7I7S3K8_9MYCO|nr:glycosyltransferase family 4 protein [Mycolicibacterium arabiense]MCV7374813.1 glycosyltransferase family 4 protein [Mycolicibacterium arabiense]BBY51030.1 glycosyl transferase [Mycolicibacterium arabiense]